MTIFRFLFIVLLLQGGYVTAQITRIPLDSLSTLDDEDVSIHILSSKPSKLVKLPPGDEQTRRFVTEFYSWKMSDTPDFVIMVESKKNGDLLYIDRNLNDDLTDDGSPLFFPFKQDSISFTIISPKDKQQQTKILFSRTNSYKDNFRRSSPDSIHHKEVDQFNNLNPKMAKVLAGFYNEPDFKGSAGSFYFADRATLRRGSVTVDKGKYSIGLFDYSNNGLYNDDDDVLFIHQGENSSLRFDDKDHLFTLNDIFTIEDHNFKVHRIDPYGHWIEIEKTADEKTLYYQQYNDSLEISNVQKVKLKEGFWKKNFKTLDGDSISLDSFRGKYLLLNFWGEWCPPCLEEIPSLVHAMNEYPQAQMQCIGFIKLQNKENAEQLMKVKNIHWPQVELTDSIGKTFMIRGLPTNILVFPNGEDCLVVHKVNKLFFKQYVK